jgi:hypothetical protein
MSLVDIFTSSHVVDGDLRIEKIEEDTLKAVGFVMGGSIAMRVNLLTGQLIDERRL